MPSRSQTTKRERGRLAADGSHCEKGCLVTGGWRWVVCVVFVVVAVVVVVVVEKGRENATIEMQAADVASGASIIQGPMTA